LKILQHHAGLLRSTTEETTIEISSVASPTDIRSEKGMILTKENTLNRPVNFDTSATTMDSAIREGNYTSYMS
jgi:hypothetical protein